MTKNKIELTNFGLDLNDVEEYKRISQKVGRIGGQHTFENKGRDWMKYISTKGVEARRKKKIQKDLVDKEDQGVDNTNI